jgi:solute carrier family 50 protein (sugar transporter)
MLLQKVLLNYMIPAVGDVVCGLLYLSPVLQAYKINKSNKLGEFNVIPYALMVFNCMVWSFYALGLPQPSQFFVITPNFLGFISGVLVISWTGHLISDKARKHLMEIFLFITTLYVPLAYAIFSTFDNASRQKIYSYITLIVQFAFIGSPLLESWHIVKSKDASSIYLPLASLTLLSSILWAVYGFTIADVTMYLPNSISAGIGLAQIVLRMMYPPKALDLLPQGSTISLKRSSTDNTHGTLTKASTNELPPAGQTPEATA